MDGGVIANISVAAVAALAGYAAQRAAANASKVNTATTIEGERLKQAYERARQFDVDTISRQAVELTEVRLTNNHQSNTIRKLREKIDELQAQVLALTIRLARKEVGFDPDNIIREDDT